MDQRELDVAQAFQRAMGEIRDARPDVLAIAGDIFDRVRPSNPSITLAFSELRQLCEALPDLHVVLVGGNHEIPRATETGCVLPLFAELPRVHVVWDRPQRLELPSGIVWGVPEGHEPPAEPEGLLVFHGDVEGIVPHGSADRPAHRIAPERFAGWDFVILGHYHVYTMVRPNAAYVGALEYVSSDVWGELRAEAEHGIPGKGWMLVELGTGAPTVQFRPGPTRRFMDLAPIEGTGLGAEDLDAAIAARVAELGDLTGAVVRLVVREVTRDVRRNLNHTQLRQWRAAALHFQLDLRRAEHEISPAARASRFKQLDEALAEFLGARPLDPAIDRAAFVERGMAAFADVGLDPTRDPYTGEKVPGLA
jgi:DNA repair exonuclease SbcCD nuclease subunit